MAHNLERIEKEEPQFGTPPPAPTKGFYRQALRGPSLPDPLCSTTASFGGSCFFSQPQGGGGVGGFRL